QKTNKVLRHFFEQPIDVNHVLAQIYYNHRDTVTNKERKAKISRHSDKTKDMPPEGLIVFTTFYDFCKIDARVGRSKDDEYDFCYRGGTSVLTELEFVLKNPEKNPTLNP